MSFIIPMMVYTPIHDAGVYEIRENLKLTPGYEAEIEKIIGEIKRIVALPEPPDAERKRICGKCSYYEFCWC